MLQIKGNLASLLDVYAGPTQSGTCQVIVKLHTQDGCGEGLHTESMEIAPDTSTARCAAIAHELALSLLAHELLEQLTIDAHATDGSILHSPPLLPHHHASDHAGVTLTRPSDLSHTGEDRRYNCPVEPGIAEVVRRLNHPVFGSAPFTRASCDGHGIGPGSFVLQDGRQFQETPRE